MTKEEFVSKMLFEQKNRKRKNVILNNPDYIRDKESRGYAAYNAIVTYRRNRKNYKEKTKVHFV